jgi:hypothetical protein
MKGLFAALLIGSLTASGCVSPETRRARGGASGADVGNRPSRVKMHEGSDPYWRTPRRIEVEHAPLDAARQARTLDK